MRTNYVLIDFENVQPKSLDQLAHDHFKVIVFVGARQTNVPVQMVTSLQLRNRIDFIKISGNGSNALDFHIAYYIGQLAAADPSAYFHIVSNDTGFDPLIDHLRTNKILAGRVKVISDIPLLKSSISKSLVAERIEEIIVRLLKGTKPRSVKTLRITIGEVFKKQELSKQEVSDLVKELTKQGVVDVTGRKLKYALPSERLTRAT